PPECRAHPLLAAPTPSERATLLSEGARAACVECEPFEELATAVGAAPRSAPIDRLIYQHCKFYLAGQNLVTVDRASMACGLEVRAPFLDLALVELAGRIPPQL